MKFNKEEEIDIPEEETASILLMDSESESDHRSTIDIPWSDGSTLLSIEEKVKPFSLPPTNFFFY